MRNIFIFFSEYFSQQDYELGDVRPCTVLDKDQYFHKQVTTVFRQQVPLKNRYLSTSLHGVTLNSTNMSLMWLIMTSA